MGFLLSFTTYGMYIYERYLPAHLKPNFFPEAFLSGKLSPRSAFPFLSMYICLSNLSSTYSPERVCAGGLELYADWVA